METPARTSTVRRYHTAALVLCGYAFIGGVVSLAGWIFDLPRLTGWDGSGISIQPNAALAALAAGIGAFLLSSHRSFVALLFGALVLIIGLSTVFQIVTEVDLGTNELLMFNREWGRTGVLVPGRMGTPGAVSWSFVGMSISLIALSQMVRSRTLDHRLRQVAASLALLTFAIASLSITGFLYGAEVLHTLPRLTVIALQTATFSLATSLAVLFLITDAGPMRILAEDSPTGRMFRQVVPGIVMIPILFGLLQLSGQRAGLYDREFGIAAATLAQVGLLLVLLWRTGSVVAASDARKTAMFHSALDGIISIDHQGRVVDFNPAAERIFGYQRADVAGRELAELVIPADQREAHRRGLARYLETGEARVLDRRIELDAMRADGASFPVELSITRIASKGPAEFTAYVRDITQRKQAERSMREARDILETRVEERTRELSALNRALERSNRELEQFASVASHDLQEPLRKIQAFGDRLDTKFGSELGEQGKDYVARMRNAATRMRGLIDGLLLFSRVATRGQDFQPVDLAQSARDAVSTLEDRISSSAGTVYIDDLPVIEADPIQMEQVFLNLVGNGLKFHRPEIPPVVRISGRVFAEVNRCEILIRDNGIGFEPEYEDRIFEVFQRLHGRQEFEGTGIGLSICRKVVERHGGTITASSEAGQGSTFTIRLPLKQDGNYE